MRDGGFITGLLNRPETALFILAFGVYGYFYQAGGWNQNSRFDLVRSIVEEGTFKIDSYHKNTGDKSRRENHYYSDKAPGASLLGAVPYFFVHKAAGSGKRDARYLAVASFATTVGAVSAPSAVAVVMVFAFGGILGLPGFLRLGLAASYGFGTLAFPYSTLLYGHQLAAAFLVAGFVLLSRIRHEPDLFSGLFSVAGFLLGFAIVADYSAVLAVIPIGVYALFVAKSWGRVARLAGGVAGAGSLLVFYNTVAFGGPFDFSYKFSVLPELHTGYFLGLGKPDLGILNAILFSDYRGLFHSSPWLIAGIPGAVLLAREPRFRAEGIVCLAVFFLFAWFNSSFAGWHGGWATGPRYMIPAVPFLAMAAGGLVRIFAEGAAGEGAGFDPRARLALGGLGAFAAVYSIFMMLVSSAVKPEVPEFIYSPFRAFLFSSFFKGQLAVNYQSIDALWPDYEGQRFAWNIGEALGFEGLATLIPLTVFVAIMGTWLAVLCGRDAEPREAFKVPPVG